MAVILTPKLPKHYSKKEGGISWAIMSSMCMALALLIYPCVLGFIFLTIFKGQLHSSCDLICTSACELVRRRMAAFFLSEKTQRGYDLLKDWGLGSDRVRLRTGDCSLLSQERQMEPELGGTSRERGQVDWICGLQALGWGSEAGSSDKSVEKALVSYLMTVMLFRVC